jgi:flagellum-specific peptidoglycan hydrolase FlgJ
MATAAEKMKAFSSQYGSAAANAAKGSKIFPQTILSAAAVESAYGTSGLTRSGNNFFGVKKGSSWTGATVTMRTAEQTKEGKVYYVNAEFRKYPTPEDSFKDYVRLLSTSRYVNAGVTSAANPEEQFKAIQKAGYATDVNYANKLTSIYNHIRDFNLSIIKSVGETVKNNKKTIMYTGLAVGFILLAVASYFYLKNDK